MLSGRGGAGGAEVISFRVVLRCWMVVLDGNTGGTGWWC